MLYLASKSKTRAQILRQVGISFEIVDAHCNEEEIKSELSHKPPEELVCLLANAKAMSACDRRDFGVDDYILGGDQILVHGNNIMHKPQNQDEARTQLRQLRGGTHHLISALTLVNRGKAVWKNKEIAEMTMRDFSDDFLEYYLQILGSTVTDSVGGYQWEGLGAQLFEHVKGDFRTVLGLPTDDLIRFLRNKGYLMT